MPQLFERIALELSRTFSDPIVERTKWHFANQSYSSFAVADWTTEHGNIGVRTEDGWSYFAVYGRETRFLPEAADARAEMYDLLAASLGVDGRIPRTHHNTSATWHTGPVMSFLLPDGTAIPVMHVYEARYQSLAVEDIFQFNATRPLLSTEAMDSIARAYLQCYFEAEGNGHAGQTPEFRGVNAEIRYATVIKGLTYALPPASYSGHCDPFREATVRMDAVTGFVLGVQPRPCV